MVTQGKPLEYMYLWRGGVFSNQVAAAVCRRGTLRKQNTLRKRSDLFMKQKRNNKRHFMTQVSLGMVAKITLIL